MQKLYITNTPVAASLQTEETIRNWWIFKGQNGAPVPGKYRLNLSWYSSSEGCRPYSYNWSGALEWVKFYFSGRQIRNLGMVFCHEAVLTSIYGCYLKIPIVSWNTSRHHLIRWRSSELTLCSHLSLPIIACLEFHLLLLANTSSILAHFCS